MSNVVLDLTPIIEQLNRIEAHIAGTCKPEMLRSKAAIALLGAPRSTFYRLVASGVIEQIKYDEHAEAVYDADQIRTVIDQHRKRSP